MRNRILIGIDVGTTVFKAAAFDAHTGKLLAMESQRLKIEAPSPGWRETPPAALDRALGQTLRKLRTALRNRWSDVAGIGVAAQAGSSVFCSRDSGEALTPMILWNDERSRFLSPSIRSKKSESWWQSRLLNAWTPAGLARIQWVAENEPDVFGDAKAIHVGAGEYVYHLLAGEWRQDSGNAIQIGSYNAATGALCDEMLRLVGFSKKRVAPMRQPGETHALSASAMKKLALPDGVPVAGPFFDQEAAFRSVHSVSRPVLCSLGTAWVGNFTLPASRVGESSIQFVLSGKTERERLVVLPMLSGAAKWDWFLARFINKNPETAGTMAHAILKESLVPTNNMICVPHVLDPTAQYPRERMQSDWAANSVRALACGLCFELYRALSALKSAGVVDRLILSGGMSKSAQFSAIIAALFAPLPVFVLREQDTAGARGALLQFNKVFGESGLDHVPPAPARIANRLRTDYDSYLRAFGESADDFARSVAYSFPKENA